MINKEKEDKIYELLKEVIEVYPKLEIISLDDLIKITTRGFINNVKNKNNNTIRDN